MVTELVCTCTAPDYTDRWTCDASGNVTVQGCDTTGTQPEHDNTNCIVGERYCLDQNGEVTFVPDYTDSWECDTSGNVTVQECDTTGTQPNADNTNCIMYDGYYLNGEEVTLCETVEGRRNT